MLIKGEFEVNADIDCTVVVLARDARETAQGEDLRAHPASPSRTLGPE